MRSSRVRAACAAALFLGVLSFYPAYAQSQSHAGLQLLSGVGYHTNGRTPSVLIGLEYVATSREGSIFSGMDEKRIALHVSDVLSFDKTARTYTLGVEGAWHRRQGVFQLGAEGSLYLRRGAAGWARIAGFGARGVTGRVQGNLRLDYVENAFSTFPWFLKDLNGVAPRDGDDSFFRATVSVSALVLPAYNLIWSQEIRWRKPVSDRGGNLAMATGPEFWLGDGRLAAQAGVLLKPDGVRPLVQVRYELLNGEGRRNFYLAAASASVEGDGPVLYGWWETENEGIGLAAAVRLEGTTEGGLNPAVYFSIQPKF